MERYEVSISDVCGEQAEELKRNLTTLFGTRAGAQPADREFGISWECLDEMPEAAESLFFLEAAKKVERYEPRVRIHDIVFEQKEGMLVPHIYFKGKEEP
ncbi:GPW/gp25 family protein [Lacrimispora saccharolytica]|uniref:IraD/Gp25-like domain-containing protein n=1 Tax=Lacrimispora saccharolytica (strain ATCC 35040 / DSM 2544 / NRCC 2533 / WM1) TaxID=610130 RepID=D9R639_LACSW|nr:GPW/gp25 family protein [Lacrimispora saccharolytica]ADL03473.1 hypothetical protein Closa_0854 [[Clostridium] saccharolyticum WM1]QRV18375.1 GPW/gp25 family protein [Lacrimispora saccharolytica]